MPIIGQFGSLAGLGSMILPGGAFESLATITVGSGGTSTVTFSDIPGSYQHLQLRSIARWVSGNNFYSAYFRPGNDTTLANYRTHYLYGSGAAAAAGSAQQYYGTTGAPSNATASVFGANVLDLLDYASTSKNKVLRCFSGYDSNGSGFAYLESTLYMNTAAITSITITGPVDFAQYSTFALYGVRS
jgi:hypothetical protein